MAGFNGSGTFVRTYNWVTDKSNNVLVTASRFDTEDDGFATGLSNVICKDGQTTTTAAVPFAVGIELNDGNVTTPAALFINEPTTGIYRAGTGILAIAAKGGTIATFSTATASINGQLNVSATASAANLVLTNPLPVASGGTADTGSAWSTYSATATGASGTMNNSSNSVTTAAQKSIGKTQFFTASCVIASATAGSGAALITLPATANRSMAVAGWNNNLGHVLIGYIAAAGTTVSVTSDIGENPGSHGDTIIVSGVYEKQ